MEKYLEGEEISPDEIKGALKKDVWRVLLFQLYADQHLKTKVYKEY